VIRLGITATKLQVEQRLLKSLTALVFVFEHFVAGEHLHFYDFKSNHIRLLGRML